MRKLLSVALLVLFFFAACKKKEKDLPGAPAAAPLIDSSYINPNASPKTDKRVLFEVFSGVRSPIGPMAHAALDSVMAKYPNQVSGIVIHAGQNEFVQSYPFKDVGQQDLNTSWGSSILSIITRPAGIPYGIVDRTFGSNIIANFDSLAVRHLTKISDANAYVRILSYDATTRELRYEVIFELTSDLSGNDLYFSTAITEDKIIGKQEYTQGEHEEFEHNHILRDMPQFAQILNPNNEPTTAKGRVFIKQFAYTVPELWEVENCRLITYIHKSVEVLQTAEIKIK